MIHGITSDVRCQYGMGFKLQRIVDACLANTRKSRLQYPHFLPMNSYFHLISALILVVNNSRALGLLFFEFDGKGMGYFMGGQKKSVVIRGRPQTTTNDHEWH